MRIKCIYSERKVGDRSDEFREIGIWVAVFLVLRLTNCVSFLFVGFQETTSCRVCRLMKSRISGLGRRWNHRERMGLFSLVFITFLPHMSLSELWVPLSSFPLFPTHPCSSPWPYFLPEKVNSNKKSRTITRLRRSQGGDEETNLSSWDNFISSKKKTNQARNHIWANLSSSTHQHDDHEKAQEKADCS